MPNPSPWPSCRHIDGNQTPCANPATKRITFTVDAGKLGNCPGHSFACDQHVDAIQALHGGAVEALQSTPA